MKAVNKEFILGLIFLILTFIVTLRVEGIKYRLPTMILIMLIPILLKNKFSIKYFIGLLFFSLVVIIHYLFLELVKISPISFQLVWLDVVKYMSLICLYIFIYNSISWQTLNELSLPFFKFLLVLCLLFWIASIALGVDIGVDNSFRINRVSGTMTEPANLSHFVPATVIYFFITRNHLWFSIGLFVLLLTFSPTVIGVLVGSVLLYLFIKSQKLKYLVFLIMTIILIYLPHFDFASARQFLSTYGVYGFVGVRVLDGIQYIVTYGDEGYNSRAALYFKCISFLTENGLVFYGTGFASSVVVAELFNGTMLLDSTSMFTVLLWFGVLAVPPYFYFQWLAIRHYRDDFLSILLISLCVSNFLTSGGVWVQIFFFTLILLRFKHNKEVSRYS